MINKIKQAIKPYLINYAKRKAATTWIKKGENSLLAEIFPEKFIKTKNTPLSIKIEKLAEKTNKKGNQPLWEGYGSNNIGGSTRTPNMVRTDPEIGRIYTYLVQSIKPDIIVEFGTAFGVSGMYFLAGIKSNKKGQLLTFDPNTIWIKLAKENLSQISNQFILTNGTFEDNVDSVLSEDNYIDIAFIDAIHTKEFVLPQLEIVISKSRKGTIIILDDINFSVEMSQFWEEVSVDQRFISSMKLNDRVGFLELK
jgi:predicted O-methyltransferase YrrM